MEEYMKKYNTFTSIQVYNIDLTCGIGDFIKFFMFALTLCIQSNTRLYYKINNIHLEQFIKLKHRMYITDQQLKPLTYTNIYASMLYKTFNSNFDVEINDVFYFSPEVKINSKLLFPYDIPYISIHIRLGDKYLETDKNYVICQEDDRSFSNEKLNHFIESQTIPILLCCDQHTFKMNLKEKYNILVTNCNVAHSGLSNTTKQQVLDSVTELYLLSNSTTIYSTAYSGFSTIAAKINHIPLIKETDL